MGVTVKLVNLKCDACGREETFEPDQVLSIHSNIELPCILTGDEADWYYVPYEPEESVEPDEPMLVACSHDCADLISGMTPDDIVEFNGAGRTVEASEWLRYENK